VSGEKNCLDDGDEDTESRFQRVNLKPRFDAGRAGNATNTGMLQIKDELKTASVPDATAAQRGSAWSKIPAL
jgi:hypothetical protein